MTLYSRILWIISFLCISLIWSPVSAQHDQDGHFMLTPDELEWEPIASMGEGAKIAFIEGDLSEQEPFTFRLKLDPGYVIRPHIHPEYERVTVLTGTLHFAHGTEFNRNETRKLAPGSLAIMPPGDPMFGYVEEKTIIQLHGNGPWGIEYLNPEDDPRLADRGD